jgi:hypothetical protein
MDITEPLLTIPTTYQPFFRKPPPSPPHSMFAREATAQQAASLRVQQGWYWAESEQGSKREVPTGRHSTARLVEDAPVAASLCFWWGKALC